MTASTGEQGREDGPVALDCLSWATDTPVCAGCWGLGREWGLGAPPPFPVPLGNKQKEKQHTCSEAAPGLPKKNENSGHVTTIRAGGARWPR